MRPKGGALFSSQPLLGTEMPQTTRKHWEYSLARAVDLVILTDAVAWKI